MVVSSFFSYFFFSETAVKTKDAIKAQFLFYWQFSAFLFLFFSLETKKTLLYCLTWFQKTWLFWDHTEHVSRTFVQGFGYPGGKPARKAGTGQSGRWGAGQLDSHEVQWDGQAAPHPPLCHLACKRCKGSLPLCLFSIKDAEKTSLFPRKTAFLRNQNPQVGNCFRNCSARSPEWSYRRQIWGSCWKDWSNRAQGWAAAQLQGSSSQDWLCVLTQSSQKTLTGNAWIDPGKAGNGR